MRLETTGSSHARGKGANQYEVLNIKVAVRRFQIEIILLLLYWGGLCHNLFISKLLFNYFSKHF